MKVPFWEHEVLFKVYETQKPENFSEQTILILWGSSPVDRNFNFPKLALWRQEQAIKKIHEFETLKSEKLWSIFQWIFTATKCSELTELNPKTIDDWYNYIREIIYLECEKEKQEKLWWWVYELDESYFWPRRIKWKRWRWAWWKTIVFGL